jgi:hypothetical protein
LRRRTNTVVLGNAGRQSASIPGGAVRHRAIDGACVMVKIDRALTAGEIALLKSVYASTITYASVRIHNYKAYFFQPDDTAMTPDGEIYFPEKHCKADFSTSTRSDRAWFVHEGAHLYQFYSLKWNIKVRGIVDRNYDYKLVPGKKFQDYGLEEQGDIAQDYYTPKDCGTIGRPYNLSDYATILPFPP